CFCTPFGATSRGVTLANRVAPMAGMAKHDKPPPDVFDPKPDVATAGVLVLLDLIYSRRVVSIGPQRWTVTGATKPVRVDTGANILRPAFIEMGDGIQVDTRTGEHVERVKE